MIVDGKRCWEKAVADGGEGSGDVGQRQGRATCSAPWLSAQEAKEGPGAEMSKSPSMPIDEKSSVVGWAMG
jgi:hypothetical protein